MSQGIKGKRMKNVTLMLLPITKSPKGSLAGKYMDIGALSVICFLCLGNGGSDTWRRREQSGWVICLQWEGTNTWRKLPSK